MSSEGWCSRIQILALISILRDGLNGRPLPPTQIISCLGNLAIPVSRDDFLKGIIEFHHFSGAGASGTRARFATKLSSDAGFGIADVLGKIYASRGNLTLRQPAGSDYSTWLDTNYI